MTSATSKQLRSSCWLILVLSACGGSADPATGPTGGQMIPVVSTTAGTHAATPPNVPPTTSAAGAAASAVTAGTPAAGQSSSVASGTGAAPSAGKAAVPAGGAGAAAGSGSSAAPSEPFSFFVTSYAAIQRLSKSANGFGGDLRYGQADGLAGADKICTEIAEASLAGSGKKGWRAFLSVTKGPNGQPVHAIDRVGVGPWYDRLGRLLAMTRADLLNPRPKGADAAIANDFPNEDGVPNHAPDGTEQVDNHDMLTGTNDMGQLFDKDWRYTCHDWTSSTGGDGTPRVGHSWPRTGGPGGPGGGFPTGGRGGVPTGGPGATPVGGTGSFAPPGGGGAIDTVNWMSSLNEAGCAPGASLVEMGPPNAQNPSVGSGGGYGGFYCFALTP